MPESSDKIPLYSVHNWDGLYENKESRKLKTCRFVCVPNKHDGSKYGRMMAHPHSERLFAAWNAIVQVASRMPERGVLSTGGEIPGSPGKFSRLPITADDLAFRTRLKAETFLMALCFFSSREMGWLTVDMPIDCEKEPYRDIIPEPPGMPGKTGAELNRIEQNRTEYQDANFGKEIDMGKKKEIVQESLIPPALMASSAFMEAWTGFLEMRKEIKKPATEYAQKLLIKKLGAMAAGNVDTAVAILEQSVTSCWQDLYPIKAAGSGKAYSHFPQRGGDEGDRPDLDFLPTGSDR